MSEEIKEPKEEIVTIKGRIDKITLTQRINDLCYAILTGISLGVPTIEAIMGESAKQVAVDAKLFAPLMVITTPVYFYKLYDYLKTKKELKAKIEEMENNSTLVSNEENKGMSI